MTKIRRLCPEPNAARMTPQCCIPVTFTRYHMIPGGFYDRRKKEMEAVGFDPCKCKRPSTLEIQGKNYCAQHGGAVAVRILLGERK